MKLRCIAAFLCASTLFLGTLIGASAESETQRVEAAFSGGNPQEMLDSGKDCEFFAIAEYKRGADLDFSLFLAYADDALQNKSASLLTRMRIALAYTVITDDASRASALLSEAVGEQRLMNVVFALHLVNNGASHPDISAEALCKQLLEARNEDGGWSVTGNAADVDTTAMVLQALAPYKDDYPDEIEAAVTLLGVLQHPDGDFLSYGAQNPESVAQVIIALTSLGINPTADAEFVKNGNTLSDGLFKYMLADGSFCHTYGGAANAMATMQAFCALTALELYQNGECGLYLKKLSDDTSDDTSDEASSASASTVAETSALVPEGGQSYNDSHGESAPQEHEGGVEAEDVIAVAVAVITVVAAAVMVAKKRKIVDVVIVASVGALIAAGLLFIDIKSPHDFGAASQPIKSNPIGAVTFSVVCPVKGETVLEATTVSIENGETVFDILYQQTAANNIVMAYTSSFGSKYVTSIGGVSEFDYGSTSGWKYSVNGEYPSVPSSELVLSDGDTVVWIYVEDAANQ